MVMNLLVLIPHYNHAKTVTQVVTAMRAQHWPVLIVDDGSDAQAQAVLRELARSDAQVQVVWRPHNGGKGAAVQTGMAAAEKAGYSHVLQVDADAQHQLADAQKLWAAAQQTPKAIVCAAPIYGDDAPKSRLYGRKLTQFWIWVNTGSHHIVDGMCGFRVYPVAAVMSVLRAHRLGRRMDFDVEILVRLLWQGERFVWVPTPVHYAPDGVSHFLMWRDNVHIAKMHARLFWEMLKRRAGMGYRS